MQRLKEAAEKAKIELSSSSSTEITRKAVLVMAISFAMGLSVELVPGILDKMPDIIKNIFSSGITRDERIGCNIKLCKRNEAEHRNTLREI